MDDISYCTTFNAFHYRGINSSFWCYSLQKINWIDIILVQAITRANTIFMWICLQWARVVELPSDKMLSNLCFSLNISKIWIMTLCYIFSSHLRVLVNGTVSRQTWKSLSYHLLLTHWGWVTHICVSKSTIIASDNGLSPDRRQAIIWNNHGILLIWSLGTNFSEFLIEIHSFSFKKIHLKMSSGKWRPFCLGLNVLKYFTILVGWCSVFCPYYVQGVPWSRQRWEITYCAGTSTAHRDHSVYGPSQWETALLCDALSLAGGIHRTIPEIRSGSFIFRTTNGRP